MDLQRKCTSCNLIGRNSTHESSSLKTNDSLAVTLHAPVQSNNEHFNFPCRSVLCLPNKITSLLTEMSSEGTSHPINPFDDVLAISADDFPPEPEEADPDLQALDTKLSKIFRRKFLAALTGRDYLLKRVRDALLHGQPKTAESLPVQFQGRPQR